MLFVKMGVLVLSLGIDTLGVAIALGFRTPERSVSVRGMVRIALAFATAEALMPLVGVFVGAGAGHLVGRFADLVGGVALLAVAAWMLWFDREDKLEDEVGDALKADPEDGPAEDRQGGSHAENAADADALHGSARLAHSGWPLLVMALGVSLDELAVGFSIGLIGVPVLQTVLLIALQAFIWTMVGLQFGRALRPWLGEWTERLAGYALGMLGLWVLGEAIVALVA
ncbi:MAG: manganese efflux pump [Firmicutes bacterium]|nr:manganese efflux pump [Bacillota bacterium]